MANMQQFLMLSDQISCNCLLLFGVF